jgi:imidazolonepropionase-like amidohydrolase
MRTLSNVLFISLLFALSCSKAERKADILIQNVQVINPDYSAFQENMSIAIKDDAILDVFPSGTQDYESKTTVDGSGKYALPGLWDMHVHFRGGRDLEEFNKKMLPLYVANGVTAVRDAGGDLSNSIISWKYLINSRFIVGPRLYYSGPKLDGPEARWEGSLEVQNADEVSAALDSLESMSAHYVKIYDSTLDADTYMEILKQTEQRGLKVTGHMPMTVMLDDAIEAGLDGIEHLYYVLKGCSSREAEITEQVRKGKIGFWSAIEALLDSYDDEKANQLFRKLEQYNVYVTPTIFINQRLTYITEEDHTNDPYLRYLSKKIIETYEGRVRSAQRQSEEGRQFRKDLYARFLQMIPEMHEAGVPLMAGSDAGAYNSYVYPGPSLHEELKLLNSSGIEIRDVLRIATQSGPEFLGVSDVYGRIENGRIADILLLNSNPIESIENLQDIYGVNMGSMYMSREYLDDLIERVRSSNFSGI